MPQQLREHPDNYKWLTVYTSPTYLHSCGAEHTNRGNMFYEVSNRAFCTVHMAGNKFSIINTVRVSNRAAPTMEAVIEKEIILIFFSELGYTELMRWSAQFNEHCLSFAGWFRCVSIFSKRLWILVKWHQFKFTHYHIQWQRHTHTGMQNRGFTVRLTLLYGHTARVQSGRWDKAKAEQNNVS